MRTVILQFGPHLCGEKCVCVCCVCGVCVVCVCVPCARLHGVCPGMTTHTYHLFTTVFVGNLPNGACADT